MSDLEWAFAAHLSTHDRLWNMYVQMRKKPRGDHTKGKSGAYFLAVVLMRFGISDDN